MPRTFRGHESVDAALSVLATASTVEQLRQAQAVVLPLRYGLNLEQTAEVIGLSPGWVSRLRNSFIGGNVLDARGGRRRQSFTVEQEAALLLTFLEQASMGGVLVVNPIKLALEKALGRTMALSTVYNILHRHGWRKLAPDKRHPQSDPAAQDAFKKTPRDAPNHQNRVGQRCVDPADVPGRGTLRSHQRCAPRLGVQTRTAVMHRHADP